MSSQASRQAPGDPGSAGRMAGDYFAAGMDETAIAAVGIEPIRPLLERIEVIDGLPAARGVIADLLRTGVGVLHGLGVAPDFDHPDIYLAWGKVRLTVWTHKIDGLNEADFVFAAKADREFAT